MLRIRDLQTTDLLYYDAAFAEDRFKFCQKRDIHALPARDEPDVYYFREKTRFRRANIESERRIAGDMNAFAPTLLAKYIDYDLLFVYDGAELTGVVHFSDYNRPPVSQYLYQQFWKYERALRELATAEGYTHEDIRAYYAAKVAKEGKVDKNGIKTYPQKQLEEYEKDKVKIANSPPFQCANLPNLLILLNHHLKLKLEVEEVRKLRNRVMHAHDFVAMDDVKTDDYIYTIESFEEFFTAVEALHRDKQRVEYRLSDSMELHKSKTKEISCD